MKRFDSTIFFAVAMLFSGASLLVAIFLHLSLGFALLFLGIAAFSCMAIIYSNSTMERKKMLKRQMLVGLIAGILATLAYDGVRLILVQLGHLEYSPFEAFKAFGKLIVGKNMPMDVIRTVGTMYHYLNGICFGIAYCVILGNRNWKWGILWALLLESMMLAVYPGWLDLKAVMKEFVALSLIGHLVYGSVLGGIAQRFLQKKEIKNSLHEKS